jgi:trehalose-phosphatase
MGQFPALWTEVSDRDSFLARIAERPSVLMLDYDGTLAPFQHDRLRAIPYPGVTQRLRTLAQAGGSRLVLVTGRPARELERLLALGAPVEIWGTHGRERLSATGAYHLDELAPDQSRALDAVAEAFSSEHRDSALAIERKPASLAIHWRALGAKEQEELLQRAKALYQELARPAELDLLPFDGGLEIRSEKVTKGTVVDQVLAECPGAVAAYLGDDSTDEDAFRRLRGRGLTALVRRENRASAAEYWIRPPEELLAFMDRWIEAAIGRTV